MSTVTTSQSWFSRLGGAFKGILVGILMLIAGIVLLFWNEGRTVEMKKALNEGEGAVVESTVDKVDPAQEGEFIHLVGDLETNDTLEDDTFGITFKGIKLKRSVEMYQWQENTETTTRKKVGGSEETTTTYTYQKAWSNSLIDSSSFHDSGYDNPALMEYESKTLNATNVKLGAFQLSPSLIDKVDNYTDFPITELKKDLKLSTSKKVQIAGNGIYLGYNISSPKIGDMKITYQIVSPEKVTVISQQSGNSFVPFVSSQGKSLEFLKSGEQSSAQIFAKAQSDNKMLAWLLRLVGFLLISGGITAILKPLEIIGDLIPFIGSIIGFGTSIVAFIVGLAISLIVIAVAWIFYRPILGISLLIIGAGIIIAILKKVKQSEKPLTQGSLKNS